VAICPIEQHGIFLKVQRHLAGFKHQGVNIMNNKSSLNNDSHGYSDTVGGITNGLVYLLIGGGIGAALALLFAPKSGVELRNDISDITRRGYDETLERAQQLRDQSAEIYQSVKDKADEVYSFAAAKLSAGTKELADAVEEGAGTVKDAARSAIESADKASKHNGQDRRPSSVM
jgi:gas vesicle protein